MGKVHEILHPRGKKATRLSEIKLRTVRKNDEILLKLHEEWKELIKERNKLRSETKDKLKIINKMDNQIDAKVIKRYNELGFRTKALWESSDYTVEFNF